MTTTTTRLALTPDRDTFRALAAFGLGINLDKDFLKAHEVKGAEAVSGQYEAQPRGRKR